MQRISKHNALFKAFSVASLLGVYVLASFFNNLHQYFHHDHHQQEICTADAEKNPCHIKVFHHNQKDGCKHEEHVYSLENKCELCDAILAKYHIPVDRIFNSQESEILHHVNLFEEPFVLKFSTASISLRGPPGSLSLIA